MEIPGTVSMGSDIVAAQRRVNAVNWWEYLCDDVEHLQAIRPIPVGINKTFIGKVMRAL